MNLQDFPTLLRGNPYPGRGILIGRAADDTKAVITYFIMGRSENSRNRIFVETEDGIETRAFDERRMTDPSLIIYHPVRAVERAVFVSNGDQTDTLWAAYRSGQTFASALRTRTFEPDAPNFTPRISGMVQRDGAYALSILKAMDGDGDACQRFFFEYDQPKAGMGHFISTYRSDGDPLPSFQGEPIAVAVDETDPRRWADKVWAALNEDNKVSLYVQFIDLESGAREALIRNKHQEG